MNDSMFIVFDRLRCSVIRGGTTTREDSIDTLAINGFVLPNRFRSTSPRERETQPKDRARFLDIARGSALECAAIQDFW
jgi:hypothetical protein